MAVRFDTSSWLPGAVLFGRAGFGVLGSEVPSTGTHGPGYLYNDLSLPADAGKEVCGRIETWPSAGTLVPDEVSGFNFSDAPDGTYTWVYRLFEDGSDKGTAIATVTIGDFGQEVESSGFVQWLLMTQFAAAAPVAETFNVVTESGDAIVTEGGDHITWK